MPNAEEIELAKMTLDHEKRIRALEKRTRFAKEPATEEPAEEEAAEPAPEDPAEQPRPTRKATHS